MRDSVMYYPVRDFPLVRIACHHQGCAFVFELPLSKIEAAMKKTKGCCPMCDKPFTQPDVEGGSDAITMLAKAVLAVDRLAANVGVQFPVSVKDAAL